MSLYFRITETKVVFAWIPLPIWISAGGKYFFATDRRAWLRRVRRCWTAGGEVFHIELRR